MKKIMFAVVAALAMIGAANAAQSYGIEVSCTVIAYDSDKSPGENHHSWYSCYVMKQEDAQKAMVTTDTVTYQTMADWLGKNFAANKESVIDNAEQIPYTSYDSLDYGFSNSGYDRDSLLTAIGIFFYDDGVNRAYNVMSNSSNLNFAFNNETGSGWVAASANVPEPTSGLLLLLGVAGLALKRKCA